jgi:type II secretion system protein G
LLQERQATGNGFTAVELMVGVVIIVIIAAIALVAGQHTLDKSRQRATMADLRAISAAMDGYLAKSGRPPADEGGIDALVMVLTPYHSSVLPTQDHWGHVYRYTCDRSGNYTIESHGKDGADGANITLGSRFDFDLDIVLSNGVFVAAPE